MTWKEGGGEGRRRKGVGQENKEEAWNQAEGGIQKEK